MGTKPQDDRAENWDLFKLKTMTDAMVQMRTLTKYKNYNHVDWDEPKNHTEENFNVVRSIAMATYNKKEMPWPYTSKQMMSKWKSTKKLYKAAAKKAKKTGNSNEDKMEIMKSFPVEMGMLISKNAASISTVGKIETGSSDGTTATKQATGRVTRRNKQIESQNGGRKELLDQLKIANQLQQTEFFPKVLVNLIVQFPELPLHELREKADAILTLSIHRKPATSNHQRIRLNLTNLKKKTTNTMKQKRTKLINRIYFTNQLL